MRFLTILICVMVTFSAIAADLEVTLPPSGTPTATDGTAAVQSAANFVVPENEPLNVRIRCQFNCQNVKVFLNSSPVTTSSQTPAGSTFPVVTAVIPAGNVRADSRVKIQRNDVDVFSVVLKRRATTPPDRRRRGSVVEPPDPCSRVTLRTPGIEFQSPGHNFLITPGGSIQDQNEEKIDEDDNVHVHVISSNATLLNALEVTRTSPTRTTGNISIIGGETTFLDLVRESEGEGAPPPCFARRFELGDFAPGEAIVEIAAIGEEGRNVLGTLRFTVNRLWHGIVSFGPVWSNLTDREYGLAAAGDDSVIIETEDGGSDVLYAVQYTYFYRGPRDVEKERPRFQINPTIGFSLNDFADHAIVGVSADAGHFLISAGVHAARVTRLARGANLDVGDPFEGTAAEIPREKKWQVGPFVSVTVDARAARTLLNAIIPGQ